MVGMRGTSNFPRTICRQLQRFSYNQEWKVTNKISCASFDLALRFVFQMAEDLQIATSQQFSFLRQFVLQHIHLDPHRPVFG